MTDSCASRWRAVHREGPAADKGSTLGEMSNQTAREAQAVHGKDPQLLVEKIVRERIYECMYWKERCFGLTAESVLDLAVELDHVGGTFGNQRPTPFLCLLLKLLQIQPSLPVVHEYIVQEDFKYLRALGLLYLRMVLSSVEVYRVLEPYLADRRRLRLRLPSGCYALAHMDEVVDELLTKDRVFDIILPRLTKRAVHEDAEELEERPLFFPLDDKDVAVQAVEEAPASATAPMLASTVEPERSALSIEETNALRTKLGLKPLST